MFNFGQKIDFFNRSQFFDVFDDRISNLVSPAFFFLVSPERWHSILQAETSKHQRSKQRADHIRTWSGLSGAGSICNTVTATRGSQTRSNGCLKSSTTSGTYASRFVCACVRSRYRFLSQFQSFCCCSFFSSFFFTCLIKFFFLFIIIFFKQKIIEFPWTAYFFF